MIREAVTASPLYWPPGWERRTIRSSARFGKTNSYRETQNILHELYHLGVHDWNVIVSTNVRLRQDGLPYANQPRPEDPGAAVWFTLRGEERVLACDAWDRVEHNLRAIAKHIEALRGQERWGVGSLEQAFRGFAALPEQAGAGTVWETLGLDGPAADRKQVEDAFRRRALVCHPDQGGSVDEWHALALARKQALEMVE